MNRKNIRHSKIRNTGLIFEFLLRQLTVDVLNKEKTGKAIKIIKKSFNERTELGKELSLYNVLINQKFSSDKKADFLISEVLDKRDTLNSSALKREKYNLIKEIKKSFNLGELLSSKVTRYRIYASIFKLFEHRKILSPEDKTEAYFNLVEHITTKKTTKFKQIFNEEMTKDEDLRILSYRILLERFNKKYSNLNFKQKSLLKHYINNVSNTNSLKEHVKKEIKSVKKELKNNKSRIKDKIVRIKLNEAINSIEKVLSVGNSKVVKDSIIVQLMRYYELIKEIKKHG
tara:strand:- start:1450 stop:2310 length:861 start_codon:yes stop_codon:yes gene_type:complete